jgi:hypothetical protein
VELGAREARKTGAGDSAYLELMARLLQTSKPPDATEKKVDEQASSLIIP